jgi:hypothetical protein
MMTGAASGIQYTTLPMQQLLPTPLVQQYLPAPPMQQYLPAPPSQQILPLPMMASTPGSSHASILGGVYCLYGGPTPSATLTPTLTVFSMPSSLTGIPRAYALSSASAAHHGDDVTGTYILIHLMHLYYLILALASRSSQRLLWIVHASLFNRLASLL